MEWLLYQLLPWLLLSVIVFFLIFRVTLFLTSFLEKQTIDTLTPLERMQVPEISPYARVMNEHIEAEGFYDNGIRRHSKGGTYRVFGRGWISPDEKIAVIVGWGTMLRLTTKGTMLFSHLENGRWLISSDEFVVRQLSDVTEYKTLNKADWGELYDFHRQRLDNESSHAVDLPRERVFESYSAMARDKVAHWVENGWAVYIDPAKTQYRNTIKAAWRISKGMDLDQVSSFDQTLTRNKLKRPGDRGYELHKRDAAGADPVSEQPLIEERSQTKQMMPTPTPADIKKGLQHSRAGIVSIILLPMMVCLYLVGIVGTGMTDPGTTHWPRLAMLLALGGLLVGFLLAIFGVVQSQRIRLTAAMSLRGHVIVLLLIVGIIGVGMLLG